MSATDRQLNATGTGSSSLDVLAVDTVSGTSSFDTPVNATATGTSTLVGSTLTTSIAGAGGIAPEGHHLTTASFNNGNFDSTITPIVNPDGACPYLAGRFSKQVRLAPFDVADPTIHRALLTGLQRDRFFA